MRVLIAYDGSPDAEEAIALAAAVRWPTTTAIRIVGVVPPVTVPIGPRAAAFIPSPEIEAELVALHRQRVADAVGRLKRDDRDVEGVVLYGRPATVLVDDAAESRAELVIAGSRGRGSVASLLLGSVSAELVDHAPCPVLVARAGRISRVVLAVDGSEPASTAETIVSTWPIFDGLPIHVVSVADVAEPIRFGLAPAAYHGAAEAYARFHAETLEGHTQLADETAQRLRDAGRQAEATMRTGGAADEIIGLAAESGADLIVLGSHGRTGLERVFLGSVARNVLLGSRASVLIVRGS